AIRTTERRTSARVERCSGVYPARAQNTAAVRGDEALEQGDLGADLLAAVSRGDSPRGVVLAHRRHRRDDVDPVLHGRLDGLEMVVQREGGALALDQEGVAVVAVRLREGAVDGDRTAASLERRPALLDLHRDAPVHDHPGIRWHAELREDAPTERRLVDQLEVGVLRLDVRRRV